MRGASCLRSLDPLVGAREQCWRHFEAERLRRLEIDDKLVFGRRLNWKLARTGALEDAVDIASSAPKHLRDVRAVGHQTAARRKVTKLVDRWDAMARSKCDDRMAVVLHADFPFHPLPPLYFSPERI